MRLASLFAATTAALLAACSSGSGDGSAGDGGAAGGDAGSPQDAASTDGPAYDAPGDGATVCNTLANVGQTVTGKRVAQDPPAPQGGTLADGTYTLTDFTIYTGPAGATGPLGTSRITLQITGDTMQAAVENGPPTVTATLTTSGTTFTATDTCPDANVTNGGYTATATAFVVFLDGGTTDAGASTMVETFTRK